MTEVRKRYRIAVAGTTVIELLRSVRPGTADYFLKDKEKFHACTCGDRYARFMELPVDFAMKGILGFPSPNPDRGKYYVKALLKAGSQSEFYQHFSYEKLEEEHQKGVAHYRHWIETIASGRFGFPSPEEWGVTHWSGYEGYENAITEEQGALMAKGLSGLYCYEKAVFDIAEADKRLNTKKHDGDWTDAQQLVYLSEPDMHFLTGDTEIKKRASASDQSNRILRFPDFLDDIGIHIEPNTK